MKRSWRRTVVTSATLVMAMGGLARPSLGVYLACAIDPAAVQQYCPQWWVNCEWPIQICFDENGQAHCGFAPLDPYTEYFYSGDACQLDRDGIPGGSDGDLCTRDSCNFTARRCDHIPIGGCFPPTATPTATPTRTPNPALPRPTATQIASCVDDDPGTAQWCPASTCTVPTNGRCFWGGGPEAGIPCGVIDGATIGTCCGATCKPLSCNAGVYSAEVSADPCASAHVDDYGNCGLYVDPTCVRCLEDRECATNEVCDRSGATFFGRCAELTPTPLPSSCRCDCNGDGRVTVNELVLAVGIALGQASASSCSAADQNQDGAVTVNELVAAVGAALSGCAA